MTSASLTDRSIELLARSLTGPAEARRSARRWADDPVLRGRTPAGVLAHIRTSGPYDRDVVFGALVRRGQAGDHRATELALVALRPSLWKLVNHHFLRDPDNMDELYGHATLVLSRIDPESPLLYDKVIGRTRAIGSAQRRKVRRREDTEVTHEIPDQVGTDDPVADAAAARVTLAKISEIAESSTVSSATWAALVAIRLHGVRPEDVDDHRSADHIRSDTSRLARRLERLAA